MCPLGETLAALVHEDLAEVVGVHFQQQTRKKGSVPEGLILQRPMAVYVETKSFDWFYDTQLERHLAALDGEAPGVFGQVERLGASRETEAHGPPHGATSLRLAPPVWPPGHEPSSHHAPTDFGARTV